MNSTSQIYINAYTLILEKKSYGRKEIFESMKEKKKNVFVIQKLYDLINNTNSFRIPLIGILMDLIRKIHKLDIYS